MDETRLDHPHWVVQGFHFHDYEQYEAAEKEEATIKRLRGKLDLTNPKMAESTYHKVMDKNLFTTIVGMCFLKELRDWIPDKKGTETLIPIEVKLKDKRDGGSFSADEKIKRLESKLEVMRVKIKKLYLILTFFVLIIIGMFVVRLASDSSPLVDAEKRAVDKYAKWEEELSKREGQLRSRERALESAPK